MSVVHAEERLPLGAGGDFHPPRQPETIPSHRVPIERWHKSLQGECIRPGTPLSLDDARRLWRATSSITTNVRLNRGSWHFPARVGALKGPLRRR